MRARVMVESLIVALATCPSPAQGWSTRPRGKDKTAVSTYPSYPQSPATWPTGRSIRLTLLSPQPLALRPVGLGPFIDMDNRRRDEEEARRKQQEAERRELARRNEAIREQLRHYGQHTYCGLEVSMLSPDFPQMESGIAAVCSEREPQNGTERILRLELREILLRERRMHLIRLDGKSGSRFFLCSAS